MTSQARRAKTAKDKPRDNDPAAPAKAIANAGGFDDDQDMPCPVVALGQRHGIYRFITVLGELRELPERAMTFTGILDLFHGDDAWLRAMFPRFERGTDRVVDWNLRPAIGYLMRAAAEEGLWDERVSIRGPGVWAYDGEPPSAKSKAVPRLVLHAGGKLLPLLGTPEHYPKAKWIHAGRRYGTAVYPACPPLLPPADLPGDKALAEALLGHLRLWKFADPELGPRLVLGYIGAAMLGAAIPWRPHVLISAEMGSGKTWLIALVAAALGPQFRTFNNFSVAGVRDALNNLAIGLGLDEAEGDSLRVAAVIELLRQMSDGAGAQGIRSTGDGGTRDFAVVAAVLMAAINPPMLQPQDRSRITEILLRSLATGTGATDDSVVRAAIDGTEAASPLLRARALAGHARFMANYGAIKAALVADGCSARMGDQLGTLMASAEMLLQDYPVDTDSAAEIAAQLRPLTSVMSVEWEEDSDSQQCLGLLLSSLIDNWKHGAKITVGTTLGHAMAHGADRAYEDALGAAGIRIEPVATAPPEMGITGSDPRQRWVMLVANRHQGLERIFHGSRWAAGGWKRALSRLTGGATWPDAEWFGGRKSRSVAVAPWHLPPPEDRASTSPGPPP